MQDLHKEVSNFASKSKTDKQNLFSDLQNCVNSQTSFNNQLQKIYTQLDTLAAIQACLIEYQNIGAKLNPNESSQFTKLNNLEKSSNFDKYSLTNDHMALNSSDLGPKLMTS